MGNAIKSNLAAGMLGLTIAVTGIVAVDATFGWVNGIKVSKSRLFPEPDNRDGLGWSASNRGKLRRTGDGYALDHREEVNGQNIFDVTYTFDEYYRRNVAGDPAPGTDKFIFFFGGSQTFGEGLADPDTLPARIQRAFPEFRTYNYAYSGYGPHQVLKKLESGSLANEVSELHGVAFYQYFGYHLQRVIGTLSYVGWAGGGAPYYRIGATGELEYHGSFASGRFVTTLLYWLLGRSAVATQLGVELPRAITREHHELFCQVVGAARDTFEAQYPGSPFVVIVSLTNSAQDRIVQDCLEPGGIAFIDLRGLESGVDKLAFPNNGHFMPAATQLIANQLAPILAPY